MADIFISHSKKDAYFANRICDLFESDGLSCWIAPRNVEPGANWDEEIIKAIDNCQCTILVLSANANTSYAVKCEVDRTISKKKLIITVRIEDVVPSRPLEFFINVQHWYDVFSEINDEVAFGKKIGALITSIKKRIDYSTLPSIINTETVKQPQQDINAKANFYLAFSRLKAPPWIFHREGPFRNVLQALSKQEYPLTLIQGLPGVGKTCLTAEILKSVKSTYDYFIVIKFEGTFSHDPYYTFLEINDFLISIGKGIRTDLFKTQPLEKVIQSIVSSLFSLNLLIVLDGIDPAPRNEMQFFLSALESSRVVKVLISSNENIFPGTRMNIIALPLLNEHESPDFIRQYANHLGLDIDITRIPPYILNRIKQHPHALITFLSNINDLPLELLSKPLLADKLIPVDSVLAGIFSDMADEALRVLIQLYLLDEVNNESIRQTLKITLPDNYLLLLKKFIAKSIMYRNGSAYFVPGMVAHLLFKQKKKLFMQVLQSLGMKIKTIIRKNRKRETDINTVKDLAIVIIPKLYDLKQYRLITDILSENFLESLNIRGDWKEYWLLLNLAQKAADHTSRLNLYISLTLRIARKSLQMMETERGRCAIGEIASRIGITGSTMNHAYLLSHKALFTEMDHNREKALSELHRSLKIHKKHLNKQGCANVEKLIGNTYLRAKWYVKAREHYMNALKCYKPRTGRDKVHAEIVTNIALCDFFDGRYEQAILQLREALKLCFQLRFKSGLTHAYMTLSLVYEKTGEYDRAGHYLRKARKIRIDTDNESIAIVALLMNKLQTREMPANHASERN